MHRARAHILVGVVRDGAGRVLIARRPAHRSHGGLWEFPGGKLEAGEAPEAALRRELHEELGLRVGAAVPMLRIDHDYPDQPVTLDVWRVTAWSGDVHGREGQAIDWVAAGDLRGRDFPEANRAIVRWLELPPLYLATPDLPEYGAECLDRIETLLRAGLRLVQFRSTRLAHERRGDAIARILDRCARHGARLLVNGSPEEAERCGAHGVHLNGARLAELRARPLPPDRLVAASTHDAAQLERAKRLDLDFAVLGPVRATATHPGAAPLGWERFGALAARAGLPVYAIGGMRPADMEAARRHGARGVAMIRGLWDQPDPTAAVRACGD